MTSAAEDYAQKRHEVLQAEAQVNAAVLLLSEATSRLTNPYPNGWKKVQVPDLPAMSSLRTMPSAPPLKNNWPSMDEVVQKITRYWNSIAAMDAAYAKVSEPLRSSMTPPHDMPAGR